MEKVIFWSSQTAMVTIGVVAAVVITGAGGSWWPRSVDYLDECVLLASLEFSP